MCGEYFQIYNVQITEKCIWDFKKINLGILIHALPAKTLPKPFIIVPQLDENYLYLPGGVFEKMYSPCRKAGKLY